MRKVILGLCLALLAAVPAARAETTWLDVEGSYQLSGAQLLRLRDELPPELQETLKAIRNIVYRDEGAFRGDSTELLLTDELSPQVARPADRARVRAGRCLRHRAARGRRPDHHGRRARPRAQEQCVPRAVVADDAARAGRRECLDHHARWQLPRRGRRQRAALRSLRAAGDRRRHDRRAADQRRDRPRARARSSSTQATTRPTGSATSATAST